MQLNLKKVHEDKRGEIYVIDGALNNDREITIIHTRRGFARGGCNHTLNDEYHLVLEGRMKYYVDDYFRILGKGDILKVPCNRPHFCEALENSITIEFGVTSQEQGNKYPRFRDIVDKINEKQES